MRVLLPARKKWGLPTFDFALHFTDKWFKGLDLNVCNDKRVIIIQGSNPRNSFTSFLVGSFTEGDGWFIEVYDI